MREDSQLWEFFLKVARDARSDLTHCQDFCDDVVVLPATSPSLARRTDRYFRVQRQVFDVDALEAGQRCVARSRLESQPALILDADLLELLTTFDCEIVKAFCEQCLRLVQRSVAVLVGERNESSVADELLGDVLISPETRIM